VWNATRAFGAWAVGLSALVACPTQPGNPRPTLTSLTPSSAERESSPFALTLGGTDFVRGATATWNGLRLPTTWVSSSTLTAQVSIDMLRVAGDQDVAVENPGPGGGRSNSLTFDIPCRLPDAGTPAQTRARLGAIYFDGWSGPLSNPHFLGLANAFPGREPLSGWQDGSRCAIEQQLLWARSSGSSSSPSTGTSMR
jgi:hypothetical protein